RELERRAGGLHAPVLRMVHLHEHLARLYLWIVDHLDDVVARRPTDAARPTFFPGPAGPPPDDSPLTTSARVRFPVHSWMIAATWSRRSRRAGAVANPGSRVSSARPMISQKRRHTASLAPPAIATWPSVAG